MESIRIRSNVVTNRNAQYRLSILIQPLIRGSKSMRGYVSTVTIHATQVRLPNIRCDFISAANMEQENSTSRCSPIPT